MFQLESSLEGMNIVNVLPRRGNALILFRPLLTIRKLGPRTEPALHLMAGANLGRETSPAPVQMPGERLERMSRLIARSQAHPPSEIFLRLLRSSRV
jgi:hypothetical protein